MAGELLVTQNWTYNKNGRARQRQGQITVDVTGNGVAGGTQLIPSGGAAINIAGVSAPGHFYCHNASATKYIKIGTKDGAGAFIPFMRLKLGETCDLFLDDLTITGTNLLYAVPEDTTAVLIDYDLNDR